MSRPAIVLCAGVLLLWSTPALAHDFWIVPSTFFPDVGRIVQLRLRVGQELRGDPVGRDDEHLKRFVAAAPPPGAERPVGGMPGADPAGLFRPLDEGLQIVSYESRPLPVELDAIRFEGYLRDEGLENVSAERARRGQTDQPGREIFSRCAKALLLAGGKSIGTDRVVGLTLELVVEGDPYTIDVGDELSARVLYDGQPLARALVTARSALSPRSALAARTDGSGRVTFRLSQPGMWLLKVVHMVDLPKGSEADWESYWASSTFFVGGAQRERDEALLQARTADR